MSSAQQPMIKIIPPNPSTHSILIAYCYTNNKTIQCQPKWSRIQQNNEMRNSRSPASMQVGNTYKCTPLDFNHAIEVEATCQFMGKQYKLVARTELVKASKELSQRKAKQKTVPCKISNASFEVQCSIGLEFDKVISITCGMTQFNLELHTSNIVILSINSFKTRINTHRYEFLQFFHECSNQKQKSTLNLSLTNLFEFIFQSQFDKDLILFKIAQNSTINNEKPINTISYEKPNMNYSHQHINYNSVNHQNIQVAQINLDSKNKQTQYLSKDDKNIKTNRTPSDTNKLQSIKKQGLYAFRTLDPKSANSGFYYNPLTNQVQKKQKPQLPKKNDKVKVSQKLIKKSQKQITQDINSRSHHQIKLKDQLSVPKDKSFVTSIQKKKDSHQLKKQFLNIFDQEDAASQPENILQNSSPEFYGIIPSKIRPITTYLQNHNKSETRQYNIPSINLRSSFQELQKYVQIPSSSKKQKQKVKTQIPREVTYQNPKSKQKSQARMTPPNELTETYNQDILKKQIYQMKRENQELKKQNAQLKKQIDSFESISKENTILKKKYYKLSEQINKLEQQRKEILADKLKCESNYHKEKFQKDNLKKQVQELLQLLQKNPTHHFPIQPVITKEKDQQQQNFTKFYPQNKLFNNGKRNYIPESRQKTPPHKTVSNNHSFIQETKEFTSNTQSRKQLRFPSYSYKYGANLSTNNIKM